MEVIKEENKIKVKSEYNEEFISRAHELQGKWDAPFWVFDERTADRLEEVLKEIYGEGFTPANRVEIEIDLDSFYEDYYEDKSTLAYKNIVFATRFGRDSRVTLKGDAYVSVGGFLSRGGSVKYPEVTWKEGTKVRLTVPVTLTESLPKGVTIIKEESQKEQLLAEKESLLKRLAEIEALLKD